MADVGSALHPHGVLLPFMQRQSQDTGQSEHVRCADAGPFYVTFVGLAAQRVRPVGDAFALNCAATV